MRKLSAFAAFIVTVGTTGLTAQGAILNYTIAGISESGQTAVSGTFSFDTTVIGPNYESVEALADLTSYNLTITTIAGLGPSSTTFSKSANTSSYFYMLTDGTGALSDLQPGFDANADGYTMTPWFINSTLLGHPNNTFPESITFSYTQVPELGQSAMGAGLGLLGFLGVRAWNRRRTRVA
ncbi:MAG: hypothetical protein AB7O66_21920 [Limisphaerales bacterium]